MTIRIGIKAHKQDVLNNIQPVLIGGALLLYFCGFYSLHMHQFGRKVR